jgi:hypothetical protein
MMSSPVCKILANEICPIDLFFTAWPQIDSVALILPPTSDLSVAASMKDALTTAGKTSVHIVFREQEKELILKLYKKFTISFELLDELKMNHDITVKINLLQFVAAARTY